jgi:MoxR-like ATPase
MEKIAPTLPKRVLLRGFDSEGRTGAVEWFKSHAIEVVNIPSLADLVVAGPDAQVALLQKARVQGPKIVSWEEVHGWVEGSVSSSEGCLSGASFETRPDSNAADGPPVESKAALPVENTADGLRILDLVLPFSPQLPGHEWRVPGSEQFEHLCMDRAFLETLRAVALGVLHGMPVALEGETAASKTSAVMYLAHLLEQPIVRLNLSGHTDASELVGRYVPADSAGMIDWAGLNPDTPWLKPDSKKIITLAAKEGRPLNDAERLAIIGREQFPVSGWRFQEGYLPQAMRNGWWILLDEMNLAETQVLERLNCALENPPGLVLTEGSGTVFGRGGDIPVHPSFRMLATMNPSEYTGRAIMSQAFADRWGVWHQAVGPGEREVEQMLRCLVFGEHPRVLIGGRSYRAEPTRAVHPQLQAIPDISSLLQRLAVFHHGIFRAAGGGGATPSIGRLKKERYSFSRRILLNLLRYIADRISSGAEATEALIPEAVQVLYLARIRDDADRKAVNNILRAGGLL